MVAIGNVGSSVLSYIYKIGMHTDGFLGFECWGKLMDTCIVILVIPCLEFVTFSLAIVIIMCSLQECVWAVFSHQYTILYFLSSVPSRTRRCLGTARID